MTAPGGFIDIAIAIGAGFIILCALFTWAVCRIAGDAAGRIVDAMRNEPLDSLANSDPRLIDVVHSDGASSR